MADRLTAALNLLGYNKAKELHHRHTLVHAISLFAGVQGDAELEAACARELEAIRSDIVTARQTN